MGIIQAGFDEAAATWRDILQQPIGAAPRDGFFAKPWKHFNLAAELKQHQ